ncbi:hypothetical protein DA792_17500 [Celeribacter baekdonensis]|uniref:Uncharacterized protein n=1 Tax=Celeribacter baekdonensis TaxID=875171 RepID=A0A2R4M6B3_9RHOB|nr:hypothetical protein DA792_17500 [Celeribacter baekdonensis]
MGQLGPFRGQSGAILHHFEPPYGAQAKTIQYAVFMLRRLFAPLVYCATLTERMEILANP